MTSPEVLLEVKSVAISYGDVTALQACSFNVAHGEFVTLLGPSGSGKTSLLRAIAGFQPISSGELRLRGVSLAGVPTHRRNVGLVFQSYALFPHMNVEENIAFGLEMRQVPKDEMRARIADVLRYVELDGLQKRRIHQLSGGQQQRIAIARALATRPDLLLLDEPMSNLDARLRTAMQSELRAMLREAGVTAIYVTHNQEEALSMSDRIVVMSEGRVRQIATPAEIYSRPVDAFVAGFVGQSNLFQVQPEGASGGLQRARTEWGGLVEMPDSARAQGAGIVMIRPERVRIESSVSQGAVNAAQGRVTSASYMGNHQLLKVDVGGYVFLVSQSLECGQAPAEEGQTVGLSWSAESMIPVEAA